MHGTLLGVVKMLVNLWFDKQHHDEPWYIGKWARELEKRYVSIKPPSCISRLPRSIVGNFGHLKASELWSFLLFYSLPCLYDLLPDSYFQVVRMNANFFQTTFKQLLNRILFISHLSIQPHPFENFN